jgi:hypothetical protein
MALNLVECDGSRKSSVLIGLVLAAKGFQEIAPPFERERVVKAIGREAFNRAAPPTVSEAEPKNMRRSNVAGTRKTASYTRSERSQAKVWWRLGHMLTCKSLCRVWYRGERLIELFSSWFCPKFSAE